MRPYLTSRPATRLRYDHDPQRTRQSSIAPFEMHQGDVEAADPPYRWTSPAWDAHRASVQFRHLVEEPWTALQAGPAMLLAPTRWAPAWQSPWSSGAGHAAVPAPPISTSHSPSLAMSGSTPGAWRDGFTFAEDEEAHSTAETLGGDISFDEDNSMQRPWLSTEGHASRDAGRHAQADDYGDDSRWTPPALRAWEHRSPLQGWAAYRDSTDQHGRSFSSEVDYRQYDQRRMSGSSFGDRSPSSLGAFDGDDNSTSAGLFSDLHLPSPWAAVQHEYLDYSILPPLPDSPPLSAAAYSLGSPTGRTFSSFAALSLGSGSAPHDPHDQDGNAMQDVSSFISREENDLRQSFAEHPPRFPQLEAYSSNSARPDENEDGVCIKFEPEPTPDLPPSPTEPFSSDSGRTRRPERQIAGHEIAGHGSELSTGRVEQGRRQLATTRQQLLRDYSSDEDDEDDEDGIEKEESPEWTPAASPSFARAVKSARSPQAVRRGSGSSITSAPGPSSAALPERISPITGLPVKAISKRSWPPKDAHKRKFKCTIPGCNKTFGRPSARETHLRSHSGQKPFTCPVPHCARSFSVFSNLKRHMVVHPTVDFRQVAVHDLPSMHWVPFGPEDPGWLVPSNEGGRLEWIEEGLGNTGDAVQAGITEASDRREPVEQGTEEQR